MKILLLSFALVACASSSPDAQWRLRDLHAASGERVPSGDEPGDVTLAVSTVGIGPSVPDSDPAHNIAPGKMVRLFRDSGPSRISGGERFAFTFVDSKRVPYVDNLVAVRIVAYSKSGKGSLLIRDVEATPAQAPGYFAPLYQFASIPPGTKATQHGDNVLLGDKQSITFYDEKGFPAKAITVTVEGFANDDISFAVMTASTNLNKTGTITDLRRVVVNPPKACPDGYFRATHDLCCPVGMEFDGRNDCQFPQSHGDEGGSAPAPGHSVPANPPAPEPHHRKCDSNKDCPGFANSCFAGRCEAEDTGQCNSNADCPGFANSCFAGHCESKDTNQCNSNADCHGFANSCFAGHCTNP